MEQLVKYFTDTALELKQVSWPTQAQASLYTALVIGISVLVALYVGAFDYLFSQGINYIISSL
jgi:preprotein translocase subunit SecE